MDKVKTPTYLAGLFQELRQQADKYAALTGQYLNLEARVELAEKTLCLTRDHLVMEIEKSDSTTPHDWVTTLNDFRFAGVRLVDACMVLLQENKRMTPQEMLVGLNRGMFRFRTSSPLREIHAALLRQNFAKKEDQVWVWIETPEVHEEATTP
jgi:hypothetical protein